MAAPSYKTVLYEKYVSTHTGKRADLSNLHRRVWSFRQHFGALLPADRNSSIVDLGCGAGALVWWLRKQGYANATGVDISAEQLAMSRSLGLELEQADVLEFLSRRPRQFQALIARDLIEHLDKQTAFDFLLACRNALAPGGTLIVQAPNAESPFFGRVRYGDYTHELAFTPSSCRQVMHAAGFAGVRIFPMRPAITGLRSSFRYALWRILEPGLRSIIRVESPQGGEVVTLNLIAVAQVAAEK